MQNNNTGRAAGVLCHISSLWGNYGIGSLGKEAYEFADFLKSAHVKYWQILPLVQTGYGNSPYSSVCCSSGNPYFIDLEDLAAQGLLNKAELESCEAFGGDVDYDNLYNTRYQTLKTAFSRFDKHGAEFISFVESGEFDAYATFMALCARFGGSLLNFPEEYRNYNGEAVKKFREEVYETDYLFWQFLQFQFLKQWKKLKNYVNSLGIDIIGDIPLYVAYDSADVWEHPELFQLDEDMNPTKVAGVPPDYFSKTGQLWGNPLYDWEKMAEDGYGWWVERIRKASALYDVVRIDHFRGLDRYYAIPADAETAETGEWLDGPKEKLFWEVRAKLGDIPMIAEDLGFMDEGVEKLRVATGFPGMKIALFAFDGNPDNDYLPHNMHENSVAYTGTHDNATALGLLEKMTEAQFKVFKKRLRAEMKEIGLVLPFVTREEAARALVALTLASPAKLAVIPVQDLLGLNDEARMNIPSTVVGNWQFRLMKKPSRYHAAILRKMIKAFER